MLVTSIFTFSHNTSQTFPPEQLKKIDCLIRYNSLDFCGYYKILYWHRKLYKNNDTTIHVRTSERTAFPTILLKAIMPHSPVGSMQDLRTGGPWFNPRLSQYSFQGLMIVIATGFVPLSPCRLFRQWLCGKAASG